MSWYRDPQLFISCSWGPSRNYYVDRVAKKYNVPLSRQDIKRAEFLDFGKHLSLGYNEESDYDTFKSSLAKIVAPVRRLVNCQGLEHDTIFYSLPGTSDRAEKLALEEKISKLVAEMSLVKDEVTNLEEQLNQEKNDRQAQVSDLTAKLEECRRAAAGCGSCNVEPWLRGCSVPSNWVPFEELDVQNLPKDIPLMITEAPGAPEYCEDTTTNVQATRFCRGIFPVVVVNIADLVPNNGKARFDPDIWCSLSSAGNRYAARKPSESEIMSFDQHMRG
ncbi:hypothetical protein MKW94_010965 [Papaver nudicaule]|uniref:Uncharacterized protein n=1 Tax=Papaver nudicaule TaxID=74823 RepID=A0AA41RPU2_PAPNU|nr:hypothetical protein [Papaver nudicaule]